MTNPTTRLIYDAFGHSGLEVYEQGIEQFDDLEKNYMLALNNNEDTKEIEQLIFNKTVLLISDTMSNRIYTEYNVQTSFEIAFDLEKFWNHYHHYK